MTSSGRAEARLGRPSLPPLGTDDVHVWFATLDPSFAEIHLLSPDELQRAKRFVPEEPRKQFLAARSMLRRILAGYLAETPASLRFSYNSYGKPFLDRPGAGGLRFNLAHSQGLVAYVVALGREVGIDIEHKKESNVDPGVIARFFWPKEIALVDSVTGDERTDAFFRVWVRKEAYIKGLGKGLRIPLEQFDTATVSRLPAFTALETDGPKRSSTWTLCDLPLDPAYAAAVAVEGDGWRLKCWRWPTGNEGLRPTFVSPAEREL